jgi:hypothetical protein
MADNALQNGTGLVATDEVTYSGDVAQVQLTRLVNVTGAEGSKTVSGDALPALQSTVPDSLTPSIPVRTIGEDITSCSFSNVASSLSASEMVQITLGTGVGVSQSGGDLLITTGTTANSEFLARSVKSWRGTLNARMKFIASQRIANQNLMFVMADLIGSGLSCTINSATSISVALTNHGFTSLHVGQFMYVGGIIGSSGVPNRYAIASIPNANTINFTVAGWPASGSCTVTLFGYSHVKTLFNGTNNITALFGSQRRGWAAADTSITTNVTTGVGTVIQMQNLGREISLSDFTISSAATPDAVSRASRVEQIPDDNLDLYLFIWSYNGTTAPASTTTFTIGFWSVEKYPNHRVLIGGAKMHGTSAPQAVKVVSMPATVPNASTTLIGDVGQQYRANATGAASGTHIVSAATTNSTLVKSSAGRVLGWSLANTTAAWKYVKLHNQATAPTAGTGVVRTIAIPPNGVREMAIEGGVAFATGIGLTITNLSADADATAVAVGDVVGDLFFA